MITKEDAIPLASTEKITATKEKILYHDANGYFRKSIITRISIVFNPCNEVRVRNNSNIRYLQHPNFDEKAIVRDSFIQVREAFDLPLMRFSEQRPRSGWLCHGKDTSAVYDLAPGQGKKQSVVG